MIKAEKQFSENRDSQYALKIDANQEKKHRDNLKYTFRTHIKGTTKFKPPMVQSTIVGGGACPQSHNFLLLNPSVKTHMPPHLLPPKTPSPFTCNL